MAEKLGYPWGYFDIWPDPTPKDWTVDYADGEDRYQSLCVSCEKFFLGNKNRVLCKECRQMQKDFR